mgnify:FL=1
MFCLQPASSGSVGAGVVVDEDGLVGGGVDVVLSGGGDVEVVDGSGAGGLDDQDHHAEAISVSGSKYPCVVSQSCLSHR